MFGRSAIRLLRENWANPTQLAQELYAMFQDKAPLVQEGPLSLEPDSAAAALQVQRAAQSADPYATFTQGNNPSSGLGPTTNGGLNVFGPSIQFLDHQGAVVALGSVPGRIVSGRDLWYKVTIYPDGIEGPGDTVDVRLLETDGTSEPIAPGRWTLVTKTGYVDNIHYYMVFPGVKTGGGGEG